MLNSIIPWIFVPYAGIGWIAICMCEKHINSIERKLGNKSRELYQKIAIGFCKSEFAYWVFAAVVYMAWPITVPLITIWTYIIYKKIR